METKPLIQQSSIAPSISHDQIQRQIKAIPTNWPRNITYLSRPIYAHSIPAEILQALHSPPPTLASASASSTTAGDPIIPSSNLTPSPNRSLAIAQIKDPQHPAYTQHGLFANAHLAPDSLLCLYTGLVYSTVSPQADQADQADQAQPAQPAEQKESDYDLSLSRSCMLDTNISMSVSISIDAAAMGNEARFVNDYRGVPEFHNGSGPNVEFRSVWVRWSSRHRNRQAQQQKEEDTPPASVTHPEDIASERNKRGQGAAWTGFFERCMALYVLSAGKKKGTRRSRGILCGEELLVSYGKGFWRSRHAQNQENELS